MAHKAEIKITRGDFNHYGEMLKWNEERLYKEHCETGLPLMENIRTWTAKYPNGYEADFKVNTSDSDCWTEAVLFDEKGRELACSEVCDTIEGEWEFEVEGETYILTVSVEGGED